MIRNLKYFKLIIYVIIFVIWYGYFSATEASLYILFLGYFFSEIIFSLIIRFLSNKKQIVVINQPAPKSSLLMTLLLIFIIGSFFFISINAFDYKLPSTYWLFGYVLFLIKNYFVSYSEGTFYVDEKGFVQPELFKRNYVWDKIHHFKLDDGSMSFELEGKSYQIPIAAYQVKIIRDWYEVR